MSRTANLRRQHDAALDLVGEIMTAIEPDAVDGETAFRIGLTLAKLTGLLRIHFAQEDKTLYPFMAQSSHAEAAATATAFQREMGDLGAAFAEFAERWSAGGAILARYQSFRREARGVFAALGDRIARENMTLYPLADAITYDQFRLTA